MVVYEKSRPMAIIQQSQSSPDRVIVSITLNEQQIYKQRHQIALKPCIRVPLIKQRDTFKSMNTIHHLGDFKSTGYWRPTTPMPSSPMPPPLPFVLLSKKRKELGELLWVVDGKVERISGRVIHSIRSGSIWDHLVCGFEFQDLIPLASERARRQLLLPLYIGSATTHSIVPCI